MANREQKRRMEKKNKEIKNINKKVKEETTKSFFEEKLGLNEEMSSFIKTLIIVVVSFLIIFGFTMLLSNLGVFDKGYSKPDRGEVLISYEEILIGSVFNKKDVEYYVIFDNFGDNTGDVYLNQKIGEYKNNTPIYKVDMTKGLNNSYLSEESNYNANKVSDLKIKLPTLIKISNGRNVRYVEGTDNIVNELFK